MPKENKFEGVKWIDQVAAIKCEFSDGTIYELSQDTAREWLCLVDYLSEVGAQLTSIKPFSWTKIIPSQKAVTVIKQHPKKKRSNARVT